MKNIEKNEIFDFEKLMVYQKSLDLVDLVYKTIDSFPPSETYNLSSQFRRAATSISLNIGEGSGGTKKEFIYFLNNARRSVRECIVCITLAERRSYITVQQSAIIRTKLAEISRMISGLINYLGEKKLNDENLISENVINYIALSE